MRSRWSTPQVQGVLAALLSAVMSGFIPILGKQAYAAGVEPFTLAMLRTVGAVAVLWIVYLLFWRQYTYIYPFGLAGCVAAGVINGLGSLLFYTSLRDLNASLSQLLFTLYPIFLTLFSWLDGYRLSRLTALRLGLALAAVLLLKWADPANANWLAALMMIAAGAAYALHVSINQRTLFDVPAPTVTLYTLTGMGATVFIGYLVGGAPALPATAVAWQPVLALMLVTLTARLTLFVGVKQLGSMQAVLINLSESLVTILAAIVFLGETFTPLQWGGAGLLAVSLLLVVREEELGEIPRPRPWLQIFTYWFAMVQHFFDPAPPPERKTIPPPPTRSED